MYLHKDGIGLKKLNRDDLLELTSLKSESWWGTHHTLIVNNEDQLKWYESISTHELYMIIFLDNVNIGIACYTDIDWLGRTLNISGSIYQQHRRGNLVKTAFSAGLDFAFEILNMQRVGAEVLENNLAAQHLEINHLGFRVEGRKRRAVYKSGQYYDSIVLGLLREEWESQDRVKSYGGSCNKNFDHDKAKRCIEKSPFLAEVRETKIFKKLNSIEYLRSRYPYLTEEELIDCVFAPVLRCSAENSDDFQKDKSCPVLPNLP